MDELLQKYIISRIDGETYCRLNGHFARHLRENSLTHQQYYEKYITGVEELCPFCGKSKKFYQKNHRYADTCGDRICIGKQGSLVKQGFTEEQWNHQREEYRKTMAQKTEEELASIIEQSKTTINKVKENGLTGIENMVLNIKKTKKENHGDENYNNPEQISKSKQKRTVEQNNETNDKRRKTMKIMYGVENNFLRHEVSRTVFKGNASIKEFVFPSGRKIGVRGYEPMAISILLERYNEISLEVSDSKNIVNSKVPVFEYINVNRHKKKYYPDIYIPSENKIVEVKSQWWYDGYGKRKYKSRVENNQRKKQACLDAGYNFEFWVWNDEKTRFDII